MISFKFVGMKAQLLSTTGIAIVLATGAGLAQSALADPLPAGANVAAGQVSIGSTGNSMTITQGSQNAIVNWNSFSIGQGHTVNFVQPDQSSAILNRVTGSTTSTIAGSLTGNGQVYLINPNGIAITKTGNVRVGGGFVASTLDTGDDEFLNGQRRFAGKGNSASLENSGVITVGRGGYAALIGGQVNNDGLISVPMGKVGLGSGEEATLDLSGDGFLQVAVPTKAGGADALVKNGGRISADGGRIVISAATARETARNAINIPGSVEAKTIGGRQGEIVIGGGAGGSVSISGRLNASAKSAGKGGKVKVTGKSVTLSGALVDASGAAGGGTVEIGGNRQGKGPLPRAETTGVDGKTVIRADATDDGAGGNVVIWSDEFTAFDGLITAKGKGVGSGGGVEVSGKAKLDFTGAVDLTAENGRFGDLLLDPYNVTIALRPSGNASGMTPTGNDSVIDVVTLRNALATANVTIATGGSGSAGDQSGDITVAVAGNLFWSSDSTLTLSAYGNIYLDTPIVATGANAGLVLNYGDFATSGTALIGRDYFVHQPVSLSGANAGLTINGQDYTLIRNADQLQAINGHLSGNYALSGTLDLQPAMSWNNDTGMIPIGDYADPFTGTFAGMGNNIEWLGIRKTDREAAGLFGVSSGTIRDVGIRTGLVTGSKYVGSLIGVNHGIVKNASSSGIIMGGSLYSGGLVGLNTGTIYGSHAEGMTFNTQGAGNGGLVGRNNGAIDESYAGINISGWTSIGGLVGENNGTITSSHAASGVSGITSVGGLAGTNNGTIANSYATGAVNGANNVGGLVGDNKGSISSAYASGGISVNGSTGVAAAGGLIGSNSGQVRDVYATGNVQVTQNLGGDIMNDPIPVFLVPIFGDSVHGSYPLNTDLRGIQKVGGLIGFNSGEIIDAYAAGDVTGTVTGVQGIIYQFVGGLIGENGGSASNVFATGSVDTNTGGADGGHNAYGTGGLVGLNIRSTSDGAAAISNAYATGDVNGGFGTGGLIGVNGTGGAVSNSYSTGDVSGFSLIGGLIGLNQDATVNGSYSTGAVSGQVNVDLGGLIGNNLGTVLGSFWNVTSSGLANGFGTGTVAGATGLDNAQMMRLASFETAGWDIDDAAGTGSVWRIYDGYTSPLLRSFLKPVTIKANDASKVYDGTDQGGAGYSASVNGAEVLGAPIYRGSGTNVGSHELTVSGLYSSQQGSDISYASGTVTITPRAITVAAADASRTYGDVNPALGYTVGGAGLVAGDTLSGALSTAATTSSGVGSYAVSRGSLAASSNYDVTYQAGILTVTPREITVTASGASRIYGDQNPAFGYNIGGQGLVNGDSLNGMLATSATARSDVGGYSITQGTLNNDNYSISYQGNVLRVLPRNITVMADNIVRRGGSTNPALTYRVGGLGLADGDSLTGSLATAAGVGSPAGRYDITKGSLGSSENYAMTFAPGTLTIIEPKGTTLPPIMSGRAVHTPGGIATRFIRQQQVLSGIVPGADADERKKSTRKASAPSSGMQTAKAFRRQN